MANPFKSSLKQCELQSKVYDKLTDEERIALDQMLKENIFEAIIGVLTGLSTGLPSHPTPWEDMNRAIGTLVQESFG